MGRERTLRCARAVVFQPAEARFSSTVAYGDPSNDVSLDLRVAAPDGREFLVPAFWAGNGEWRARYSSGTAGTHRFSTVCSDAENRGLHGVAGSFEIEPADAGGNPLFRRGPVRVSEDGRGFEHADGTPFLWLGDTWWMGFCRRMTPAGFRRLARDRAAKGFTVVQIVAGLYPDMAWGDPRGENEAGLPWERDFSRINPAWFDAADRRLRFLVGTGLVPCVVGCWGYFLPLTGIARMKSHWRYLIARWGAFPVVWCLAGEGQMPYYLSTRKDEDRALQTDGWTELGRFVRETDPFGRPVTIHPTRVGRDQVRGDAVLDFDMLQTGHGGDASVATTIATVRAERARVPAMPVVVGEVSYEGILHGTGDETQRLLFWAAMLSGAAGFTYGANGIWQVNTRTRPFGPSPHGANWGTTPWEDAHRLPGSGQLGICAALLRRYPWRRFEPRQDWCDPAGGPENTGALFCAGIPREVRIVYLYNPVWPWQKPGPRVLGLEPDVRYEAFYFDPRGGAEHPLGEVRAEADGSWPVPLAPEQKDWVLVIENAARVRPGPRKEA